MVTPASLNELGNVFLFHIFLDIISFIDFHVFFISCLKLVKQDSKYVFFANRMLRLSIALNYFKLYLRIPYSVESGIVNFTCLYNLSRYLIDLKIPWIIHEYSLCFCLLNFITYLSCTCFWLYLFHNQLYCNLNSRQPLCFCPVYLINSKPIFHP